MLKFCTNLFKTLVTKTTSFFTSKREEEDVKDQVATFAFDDEALKESFSGTLFFHTKEGKLIKFYKYEKGKKIKEFVVKKDALKRENNSNPPTWDELLWLVETSEGYNSELEKLKEIEIEKKPELVD